MDCSFISGSPRTPMSGGWSVAGSETGSMSDFDQGPVAGSEPGSASDFDRGSVAGSETGSMSGFDQRTVASDHELVAPDQRPYSLRPPSRPDLTELPIPTLIPINLEKKGCCKKFGDAILAVIFSPWTLILRPIFQAIGHVFSQVFRSKKKQSPSRIAQTPLQIANQLLHDIVRQSDNYPAQLGSLYRLFLLATQGISKEDWISTMRSICSSLHPEILNLIGLTQDDLMTVFVSRPGESPKIENGLVLLNFYYGIERCMSESLVTIEDALQSPVQQPYGFYLSMLDTLSHCAQSLNRSLEVQSEEFRELAEAKNRYEGKKGVLESLIKGFERQLEEVINPLLALPFQERAAKWYELQKAGKGLASYNSRLKYLDDASLNLFDGDVSRCSVELDKIFQELERVTLRQEQLQVELVDTSKQRGRVYGSLRSIISKCPQLQERFVEYCKTSPCLDDEEQLRGSLTPDAFAPFSLSGGREFTSREQVENFLHFIDQLKAGQLVSFLGHNFLSGFISSQQELGSEEAESVSPVIAHFESKWGVQFEEGSEY